MSTPAEVAAARLAREMTSWKSIELLVHEDVEPYPGDSNQAFTAADVRYLETAGGQRLYELQARQANGKIYRSENYSDGRRFANVTHDREDVAKQRQVLINRSFGAEHQLGNTHRPDPLGQFYVGKVPLYEALPSARHLGSGRVAGRPCDVFLFSAVRWGESTQDLVYSLDATMSIPLKVESRPAGSAATERPRWVWEAETLDVVSGHPIVIQSTTISQRGDSRHVTKTRVTEVHYDRDYPATTFWPEFLPGVHVIDTIARKEFHVPETTASTTMNPVRATPSWEWSHLVAPGFLGIGIAVLFAAVIVRRRRLGEKRGEYRQL